MIKANINDVVRGCLSHVARSRCEDMKFKIS